jgi:MFS family permease
MVAIAMAQILLNFNVTAVKVSIDGIAHSLSTSSSAVKTAIAVYSFVVAALVLPGARFARKLGVRRTFRLSIALFGFAMLVMTVSTGKVTMDLAQVIAGAATAPLVPTLVALMVDSYPGVQRRYALGWLSAAQASGIVPGILIGGVLATWLHWRIMFALLVLMAAGIYWVSAALHEDHDRAHVPFDGLGFVLAVLAVSLIGAGVNNITDWGTPAPLAIAAGIFLIKVLLLWERRYFMLGGMPLVPPEIFRGRHERSILFSMFVVGVLGAAITFVVPLYIEVVQGRSSFDAAIALAPFAAASFIAGILVVRLRRGQPARRIARIAFCLVAAGAVLFGLTIHNDWSSASVILSMVLAGIGQGALAALLFDILVLRETNGHGEDLSVLCGTAGYLAAGVGTALASALIVTVLSGIMYQEIRANPLVPAEIQSHLQLDDVSFISNDALRTALSRTNLTSEQVDAAVQIHTEARLHALKLCFFSVSALALLAFFPVAALPDDPRSENASEGSMG